MSALDRVIAVDVSAMPQWRRVLIRAVQFLAQVFKEFGKDYGIIRASGLAYTSLLSLVPLFAVMFTLFTGFKAFENMKDSIQSFLFSYFIPTMGDQIQTYMNQFMSNTQTISLFGMIGLLVTSVLLFQNIENAINAVWKTADNRKRLHKFVIFTSVLIWGTIFIGASFYISGKLRSLMGLDGAGQLGFLARASLSFFPLILSIFAFVIIMGIVPSTKVKFRSALVGGATGGLLWEVAKHLFQSYAAKSVGYSVIYGSLALIPIFLVWLYLTWIIVILAAEVTYVHQNFRALMKQQTWGELSTWDRVLLSLQIFLFIANRFYKGEAPAKTEDILDNVTVPVVIVREIVDKFVTSGDLLAVDEPVSGYVPSRSLDRLRLRNVLETIMHNVKKAKHQIADASPTDQLARKIMAEFETAGLTTLNDDEVSKLLQALY